MVVRAEGPRATHVIFDRDDDDRNLSGPRVRLQQREELLAAPFAQAKIQDDRGELYPFAAETAVYQDPRVKRAALVARGGKRILAVEYFVPGQGPHPEERRLLLLSFRGALFFCCHSEERFSFAVIQRSEATRNLLL